MPGQSAVRFLLGNQSREIADISPTMTVLEYLRQIERMTGTKEGCAEGDCGACTVAIAECKDGSLDYKACNACIMFVPFLHGKQLITVEHLKNHKSGRLHPAQQLMVDQHGSQCGFCTPGFVMSLFAMYHNRCDTSRTAIDDALAGNLCRCTGYAPIVRAAKQLLHMPVDDEFSANEQSTLIALSQLHAPERGNEQPDNASLHLQHTGGSYHAPQTLPELGRILQENPASCIVAGATDVGLWVTKERRELRALVYTGAVKKMRQITITDRAIEIGAAATVAEAMETLSEYYPSLEELFRRYGSVQVRNLATIGGNVANGSPIGDSLPALVALNAELKISRANASRTVSAEDFFIDYGQQDIAPGEFLERIDIPLPVAGQEFRIYKVSKRFHQDISAVCGAYSVVQDSGALHTVRVCYGGMAAIPRRASRCEQVLAGAGLTDDSIEQAKLALREDFAPISDFRGSAEYRTVVAGNLLERFANDLTGKQIPSVWEVQYA